MNLLSVDIEQLFATRPGIVADFTQSLVAILAILLATLLFLACLRKILKNLAVRHYLSPPFVTSLYTGVKWLTLSAAIVLILQQAGIKVDSLWTILSAALAMVAIGFVAVWSVLSNLLCTVMLVIFQPFRVGDEIEVIDPAMTTGLAGRVRNINLVYTRLHTSGAETGDTTLFIPNNIFFQKIIRTKKGGRSYSLDKQLFEEKSLLNGGRPESERTE